MFVGRRGLHTSLVANGFALLRGHFWHPVVFYKSGTTPTSVVLRSSQSKASVLSCVAVLCNVPQCLVVIHWLSGLWALGLIYPNIQA